MQTTKSIRPKKQYNEIVSINLSHQETLLAKSSSKSIVPKQQQHCKPEPQLTEPVCQALMVYKGFTKTV